MRTSLSLILLLFLITDFVTAQSSIVKPHPLSRQDSATIENYEKKYEHFLAENDRKEASRWINEIAFIYWNHSHFRKAIEYYERSIELNKGVQNENGIAMINNNLGMLYSDIQEYDQSLDNFKKTLAARRVGNEKYGIIAAQINISVVLNNLKRYPESVKSLEEALTLARELNDADQMKSCYGMLAETYTKMGQNAEAMKYFELYKSFHEMLTKEKVYTSNKEKEQAELRAALAEAEKKNKELELRAKDNLLNQQEKKLTDLDSAKRALLDNLSKEELKIAFLEQEQRNKNLEIQKANLEKAQLDERLQAARLTQNLTFGAIFLLLVIVVLILIVYRNKRRASNLLLAKNADILQKNEEIRAQSEELISINERLVELDQFKERMTGMIVHDLKNPLNTIIHLSKNKKELQLQPIYQSGRQMLNLVMNILDVQKFEDTRLQIEKEVFELTTVAKRAVNDISLMAQSKNIKVTNFIPAHLKVNADNSLIERVFLNLLINAVKYTPNNGEVKIKITDQGQKLKVLIEDTGEGIAKDQMGALFTKFGQVSSKKLGENKSTGLGLFFCKTVIEAHHGEIGADSEVGKGSTFWFLLDLAEGQSMPTLLKESAAGEVETKPSPTEKMSEESKAELLPYLTEIRKYEIYEATEINEVLNRLPVSEKEDINQWKEELKNAIFNYNTEKFEQLINL